MEKLSNWLRWGIIGGFLGGLVAIIGFWILSPSVDSLALFIILRIIIGSVVAAIIGPILAKNKLL